MNHIARLQQDLGAAHATLQAKAEALQAFRVHLTGQKFAGFDADGSRRDWIATGDVLGWLTSIADAEG